VNGAFNTLDHCLRASAKLGYAKVLSAVPCQLSLYISKKAGCEEQEGYLHQHLRSGTIVARIVAASEITPLLSSLDRFTVGAVVVPTWSGHAGSGAGDVETSVWDSAVG
jgi:hypothetical protein